MIHIMQCTGEIVKIVGIYVWRTQNENYYVNAEMLRYGRLVYILTIIMR